MPLWLTCTVASFKALFHIAVTARTVGPSHHVLSLCLVRLGSHMVCLLYNEASSSACNYCPSACKLIKDNIITNCNNANIHTLCIQVTTPGKHSLVTLKLFSKLMFQRYKYTCGWYKSCLRLHIK